MLTRWRTSNSEAKKHPTPKMDFKQDRKKVCRVMDKVGPGTLEPLWLSVPVQTEQPDIVPSACSSCRLKGVYKTHFLRCNHSPPHPYCRQGEIISSRVGAFEESLNKQPPPHGTAVAPTWNLHKAGCCMFLRSYRAVVSSLHSDHEACVSAAAQVPLLSLVTKHK